MEEKSVYSSASVGSLESQPKMERLQKDMSNLQTEVDLLRKRLKRRNLLLDDVRRAYLKDVVAVRVTGSQRPTTSVDLRDNLTLYAPSECEFRVAHGGKLDDYGGHVEVIHRESRKVHELRKKVEDLIELEQDMRYKATELEMQQRKDELALIDQREQNEKQRDQMSLEIAALKKQVETHVDEKSFQNAQKDIRSLTHQLDKALATVAELQPLKNETKQARDAFTDIKHQLVGRNRVVEDLRNSLAKAKTNIEDEIQRYNLLDTKFLAERESRKQDIQAKDDAVEELQKVQDERTYLQKLLDESRRKEANARQQVADLKVELEDTIENEEKEQEALREQVDDLRAEARKARSETDVAEKALVRAEKAHKKALDTAVSQTQRELTTKHDVAQKELKSQLRRAEAKADKLEAKVKGLANNKRVMAKPERSVIKAVSSPAPSSLSSSSKNKNQAEAPVPPPQEILKNDVAVEEEEEEVSDEYAYAGHDAVIETSELLEAITNAFVESKFLEDVTTTTTTTEVTPETTERDKEVMKAAWRTDGVVEQLKRVRKWSTTLIEKATEIDEAKHVLEMHLAKFEEKSQVVGKKVDAFFAKNVESFTKDEVQDLLKDVQEDAARLEAALDIAHVDKRRIEHEKAALAAKLKLCLETPAPTVSHDVVTTDEDGRFVVPENVDPVIAVQQLTVHMRTLEEDLAKAKDEATKRPWRRASSVKPDDDADIARRRSVAESLLRVLEDARTMNGSRRLKYHDDQDLEDFAKEFHFLTPRASPRDQDILNDETGDVEVVVVAPDTTTLDEVLGNEDKADAAFELIHHRIAEQLFKAQKTLRLFQVTESERGSERGSFSSLGDVDDEIGGPSEDVGSLKTVETTTTATQTEGSQAERAVVVAPRSSEGREVSKLKEEVRTMKKLLANASDLKRRYLEVDKKCRHREKTITALEAVKEDLCRDRDLLGDRIDAAEVVANALTTSNITLDRRFHEGQAKVDGLQAQADEVQRKLDTVIDRDRLRLETNVGVGTQWSPESVDASVQTTFKTPGMTLRRLNSVSRYPHPRCGPGVVMPAIDNDDRLFPPFAVQTKRPPILAAKIF